MSYTADDLITSVRRRAKRPSASADDKISDTDILALADEEIGNTILPMMLRASEEYYVRYEDLTPDSNGQVRIPSRAVAGAVRDITRLDDNGNEYSLPEIPLEDIGLYSRTNSSWWSSRTGYTFIGDKIQLLPKDSTGTVRVWYAWRPGRLVKTTSSQVSIISSIQSATSLTAVAAPISTGEACDVVQANPNFDLLVSNNGDTTVAGNAISFTTTGLSLYTLDVAVNDYICVAGVTPIVHVPADMQHILTESVVVRCLMLAGDYEAMQYHESKLRQSTQNAMSMYDPRNKGETKKIVNRNSAGRTGGRYRGGY